MWKNLLGYAVVIWVSIFLAPAVGILIAVIWWGLAIRRRDDDARRDDRRWAAERMMTYDERQREAQRRESCRPQNV